RREVRFRGRRRLRSSESAGDRAIALRHHADRPPPSDDGAADRFCDRPQNLAGMLAGEGGKLGACAASPLAHPPEFGQKKPGIRSENAKWRQSTTPPRERRTPRNTGRSTKAS